MPRQPLRRRPRARRRRACSTPRAPLIGAVIIGSVVAAARSAAAAAASPVRPPAGRPVLLTGLVCLSFVVAEPRGRVVERAPTRRTTSCASLASLAFLALPFAYLLGLLRSRYARAGTVERPPRAPCSRAPALRDALADALGDPSLRLALLDRAPERWRRPSRPGRASCRSDGRDVTVERDGECDRRARPRCRAARRPPLRRVPPPRRPRSRWRTSASRPSCGPASSSCRSRAPKLIEVRMAERRRLERDLHDGAQQRLVALVAAGRHGQRKLHDDPAGGRGAARRRRRASCATR